VLSLQNPYDPTVGNQPNQGYVNSLSSQINQSGIPFNRSEQMSLKGDTYKPFTVGLEDIDEALMYYFPKCNSSVCYSKWSKN
jgi:hypothetical protein